MLKGRIKMKLTNKTYDILKWIVVIVLPAAATLYAALGGIWGASTCNGDNRHDNGG